MSLPHEATVKLVSVKLRPGEPAPKAKRRILKSLRASEWKDPLTSAGLIHNLPDLRAQDVSRVVSNSRYIGFLLRDGRVCRMQCRSASDAAGDVCSRNKQPRREKPASFQVHSDAVYAQRLQAELDAEENRGGERILMGGRERGRGGGGYGRYNWFENSSGEPAVVRVREAGPIEQAWNERGIPIFPQMDGRSNSSPLPLFFDPVEWPSLSNSVLIREEEGEDGGRGEGRTSLPPTYDSLFGALGGSSSRWAGGEDIGLAVLLTENVVWGRLSFQNVGGVKVYMRCINFTKV